MVGSNVGSTALEAGRERMLSMSFYLTMSSHQQVLSLVLSMQGSTGALHIPNIRGHKLEFDFILTGQGRFSMSNAVSKKLLNLIIN